MTADDQGEVSHSTPASMLRWIPIAPLMVDGVLTLADGRLTFTKRRGDVVLSAPVAELHSVTRGMGAGLYLWHGARRYRFLPSYRHHYARTIVDGPVAETAAGVRASAAQKRTNAVAAASSEEWIRHLAPLAGQPPAGVRVNRPWPMWAIMLTAMLAAVILIVVLVIAG